MFFNDTATTEIYTQFDTLSLHDALPILKVSDINAHMTTKGGILGLPAKSLIGQAQLFIKMGNMLAFEAIFALLTYGLFLFPNIDKFVDINAIRIFLIRNPVSTLLADAYHSVHLRNFHKGGMITYRVPLLYKWFTSHQIRSLLGSQS